MSRYVIEERAAGWRRWRVRSAHKKTHGPFFDYGYAHVRVFRTRKAAERHLARLEANDRRAHDLKTWREVR